MIIIPLLVLSGLLLSVLLFAYPLSFLLVRLVTGKVPIKLQKVEFFLWRLCRIKHTEMNWQSYAITILCFNFIGFLFLYSILIFQHWLPLNPQQFPGIPWDLAFNTAASFITNTNWQAYSGENTLSYFSQAVGLSVQNFLSAATGIAVAFAIIRAISHDATYSIGNAWQDLMRITLYLLLPLSLLFALIFVSQGSPQNFQPYLAATALEGNHYLLPMGPVASQEAIKLLGSNGGGFFAANSAHPFENPTVISNLIQMLAILLIPCALCLTFGQVVGDKRQGYALLWVMVIILSVAVIMVNYAEQVTQIGSLATQGSLEGIETRFGILLSSLFATVNTATSCGATNAALDSFSAPASIILLCLMQLGEIVFGGVGAGLYSILLFVLLTVFIAGLMTGRTPEYLGKKITVFDMKMTAIAILIPPTLILTGMTLACIWPETKTYLLNPGAHGFTELLYALTSTANNNGSAFAGFNSNMPFYNMLLGVIMLLGRFGVMVPILAIAGSLVSQKTQPPNIGTLPTYDALFIFFLISVILLVGALTFVPALMLGPIAEYLYPL